MWRRAFSVLVVVAAGFAVADSASAVPGDVATAFSGDGIVSVEGVPRLYGLIEGPGETVITGGASNGYTKVVRYRGDGTLDPSFGENGTVRFPAAGRPRPGLLVAAPGDRLLVTWLGRSGLNLALLNASDGSRVGSFGVNGRAAIPTTLSSVRAARVLPDGRVIIVGVRARLSPDVVVVFRFTRTGTVDDTYGEKGSARTSIDQAHDFLIRRNGTTLFSYVRIDMSTPLGGGVFEAPVGGIARIASNGRLDPEFGFSGFADVYFGPYVSDPMAFGIDERGRPHVAMFANAGRDRCVCPLIAYRMTLRGRRDPDFGIDGAVMVGSVVISERAVYPFVVADWYGDSRVVGFGPDEDGNLAASLIDSAGELDTEWGTNGSTTSTSPFSAPFAVAVDSAGRALVAARGSTMRLDSAGELDASFGTGGVVARAFSGTMLVAGDRVYFGGQYGGNQYSPAEILALEY